MSVRYQQAWSINCYDCADRKRSPIFCQDAEPPRDHPKPSDCSIFERSLGFVSFGYNSSLKELWHILRESVSLTKFSPCVFLSALTFWKEQIDISSWWTPVLKTHVYRGKNKLSAPDSSEALTSPVANKGMTIHYHTVPFQNTGKAWKGKNKIVIQTLTVINQCCKSHHFSAEVSSTFQTFQCWKPHACLYNLVNHRVME